MADGDRDSFSWIVSRAIKPLYKKIAVTTDTDTPTLPEPFKLSDLRHSWVRTPQVLASAAIGTVTGLYQRPYESLRLSQGLEAMEVMRPVSVMRAFQAAQQAWTIWA